MKSNKSSTPEAQTKAKYKSIKTQGTKTCPIREGKMRETLERLVVKHGLKHRREQNKLIKTRGSTKTIHTHTLMRV